MKKKILFISAILIGAGITGISAYSTYKDYKVISENELLLENIEVLANGNESSGKKYAWSGDIDCPGLFTGDYEVCEEDGPGEECHEPGAKTCQCGKNC